jgi:hypothetical protein
VLHRFSLIFGVFPNKLKRGEERGKRKEERGKRRGERGKVLLRKPVSFLASGFLSVCFTPNYQHISKQYTNTSQPIQTKTISHGSQTN